MNKTITLEKSTSNVEKNETINLPEKVAEEPSQEVINNILNYSKALSITPSEKMEHIEVVLN